MPYKVTEEKVEEFEQTKVAIGSNIILNILDTKKSSLVVTDMLGDGFSCILLQKQEERLEDEEGGWVVLQVGSAAIKYAWKNYSAIELEATCVVWTLELLAFGQADPFPNRQDAEVQRRYTGQQLQDHTRQGYPQQDQ